MDVQVTFKMYFVLKDRVECPGGSVMIASSSQNDGLRNAPKRQYQSRRKRHEDRGRLLAVLSGEK